MMPISPTPPIATPEPISLSTFFAVEMLYHERYWETVKALLTVAAEHKIYFRRVESLSMIPAGKTKAIRLRSDLERAKLPALEAALAASGRGLIYYHEKNDPGGSSGFFGSVQGKNSPCATSLMTSIGTPNEIKMFRGPKIKDWQRQFTLRSLVLAGVKFLWLVQVDDDALR